MPNETKKTNNGYEAVYEKLNSLSGSMTAMPFSSVLEAFGRAASGVINQPQIQNARIKAISSLPCEYSKEDIGEFLRNPYGNEMALRQTAQVLKQTAYPFYKIIKTYQDIGTYRHYIKPMYMDSESVSNKEFVREATLLDKFTKVLKPDMYAHKITGQAMTQGKVFYYLRYEVDKVHNKVKHAFMQQLPEDWCYIIGYNNISGYTVSFNMMYFMTPGTTPSQFGDLFTPYLTDFLSAFEPVEKIKSKAVYLGKNEDEFVLNGKSYVFCKDNIRKNAVGNPRVFEQNGTWCYYVSLPIDKIWTFEIDDTNPAVITPLSGMLLTYAQQADFEALQKALLTNPLIKIFTGEIPYFSDDGSVTEDHYKLSNPGRMLFETLFYNLMSRNNTSGVGIYSAPFENIKSHDFPESANANDISGSFNTYAGEKSGLAALIPVDKDIKAAQVEASQKLESRYATTTIYKQFENMINYAISTMNLKYDWEFKMFGTIYNEGEIRENALKQIANGDTSQHFVLSALDGTSWLDKVAMMTAVKESGMLDMLIPPITSYTMKQEANGGLPPQNGRPQSDGISSEAKEKSIDAGESNI